MAGFDDLGRGMGGTPLLEPGDVVDRDPGQQGQLLAPQACRAPLPAGRRPRRFGPHPVAPAAHRFAELHCRRATGVPGRPAAFLVPPVPGRRGCWLRRRARRMLEV